MFVDLFFLVEVYMLFFIFQDHMEITL